MPTTHVFAIGGTGARILKSLAFLLATGVETKPGHKIRPVFLDPDKTNEDGNRAHKALTLYRKIRSAAGDDSPFFKTALEPPHGNEMNKWGGSLGVEGHGAYFKDRINFTGLNDGMQELTRSLFGSKLLDTTLEKGYLGNPNIGTVAMNMVKSEPWFTAFANNFRDGDDIILIGSIFGGTGAAGLPLLIKTLRKASDHDLPNAALLAKARIGAIIVQPYFGVEPKKDSPINQNTFRVKTKAALLHYRKNIDSQINVNYPLGDDQMKPYPNNEGGSQQENPAHLVELIGAMNIIHFIRRDEKGFVTFGGKQDDRLEFRFKDFGSTAVAMLQKPMTQYTYAVKYWNEHLRTAIQNKVKWTQTMSTGGKPLDDAFLKNDSFFANDLREFNELYFTWLQEMSKMQHRKFMPFNIGVDGDHLHELTDGITQNKVKPPGKMLSWRMLSWSKVEWTYADFDEALNTAEKDIAAGERPRRFLKLFHEGTSNLFDYHIPTL
jgi:hypothetical protein